MSERLILTGAMASPDHGETTPTWDEEMYYKLVFQPLREAGIADSGWSFASLRKFCILNGQYRRTGNFFDNQPLGRPFALRLYSASLTRAGFDPVLAVDLWPGRVRPAGSGYSIADHQEDLLKFDRVDPVITITLEPKTGLGLHLKSCFTTAEYHDEPTRDGPFRLVECCYVANQPPLGLVSKIRSGCVGGGWACANTIAKWSEEGYRLLLSNNEPPSVNLTDSVGAVMSWIIGGGKTSLVIGGATVIEVPQLK